MDALQGVSAADAEHLKAAFNIGTVRDLGTNKYFLWAQAIAKLAESAPGRRPRRGGPGFSRLTCRAPRAKCSEGCRGAAGSYRPDLCTFADPERGPVGDHHRLCPYGEAQTVGYTQRKRAAGTPAPERAKPSRNLTDPATSPASCARRSPTSQTTARSVT